MQNNNLLCVVPYALHSAWVHKTFEEIIYKDLDLRMGKGQK